MKNRPHSTLKQCRSKQQLNTLNMAVSTLLIQWKEDMWRTSTSTSRNTEHLTGLSMLNGLCLLHAFGEVDNTLL